MVKIGTVSIPADDRLEPDELVTQVLKEAARLSASSWTEYTYAKNKVEPPHICDGCDHIVFERRKLGVIQQSADVIYTTAKLLESLGVDDITEFIQRSYDRNEVIIALDKAKNND